jgi:4-amino-4-deoxy-L-arabinose transferase-like glycosyltransferase
MKALSLLKFNIEAFCIYESLMKKAIHSIFKPNQFLLISAWLTLVVISLLSRSFLPIDETRYVTVAWNMYLDHNYWVPHLNGETYSHKPPLLFWLINLGWQFFGVNNWWPRLLPSLFALGALFITRKVAKILWPQRSEVGDVAAFILLGSGLWAVFTTATMFDMILAFFTLWAIWGLLVASQGEQLRGGVYVALAVAGGLLTKGPTMLLQIMPLALLAPWWAQSPLKPQSWFSWYRLVLLSIVLGIGLLLLWAVPAGIIGGEKYQHEIFWGQTANRMVQSFAHRRPLYWYFPILPIILFPWLFALPIWRAFGQLRLVSSEIGIRFCMAWAIPVFIAFSAISGKQPHYLLPIIPAISLLMARGIQGIKEIYPIDRIIMALVGALIGCVIIYLPIYHQQHYLAPWILGISPINGILLMMISIGLMLITKTIKQFLLNTTFLGVSVVIVLYVGIIHATGLAYNLEPISQKIKQIEDQQIPIANLGKYPGQFNFLGRLKYSPTEIDANQIEGWFDKNPNGLMIAYFDKAHPLGQIQVEYKQPYRAIWLAILTKQQWNAWLETHHESSVQLNDINE